MEEALKEFEIHFNRLPIGDNSFDYIIDNEFFGNFEYSLIKKANIKVHVNLDRQNNFLQLTFKGEGFVVVPCDRCCDEFEQPVSFSENLTVKFSDYAESDDDDLIYLPENAQTINITEYLYMFANLALPLRAIHPQNEKGEETCNPEALELLEKYSTQKKESQWDALNEIKNKLK